MPIPETPKPVTDPQPPEHSLEAAFERRKQTYQELTPEEVVVPHALDPRDAVAIVNGSLGRIEKHRDELVAKCGEPARAALDELPGATKGARYALVTSVDVDTTSDLGPLETDLRKEHGILLADADTFGKRGLIDPQRVDLGRPVQGYRALIQSTHFLVHLLQEHRGVIEGKTPLTQADLDRAEDKARRFGDIVDAREVGATRRTGLDMRNRAVAHALRTYDQVRRYLTFVRWAKGDADTIAPSVYSGRRRSRGGSSEPVVIDVPTPMEPMPGVPNNGGGPFAP